MPKPADHANANNIKATPICDAEHEDIQRASRALRESQADELLFLRQSHEYLKRTVRPVYSVNEWQPASRTLQNRQGSCSQRSAVSETIARAAGIPTRVHAFGIKGSFWYPRFLIARFFIPRSILLVWPQFYIRGRWLDFDELHGSMDELASKADGGFTNSGESIFDAVSNTPVDFLGKTCGLACSRPEYDLSKYLETDHGMFDCRDDAFDRLGSFQKTLRGRAFELVYGGRKSS